MVDFVELQEERERKQLAQIGAAMKDPAVAWEMFNFILCLQRQGHPTARKIVTKVMTYEPPQPVREYMELGDAEIF